MARNDFNNSVFNDGQDETEPIDMKENMEHGFPGKRDYALDDTFGSTEPRDNGETVIAKDGFTPTVGWLVCIKGNSKGADYKLHAGWNYIGRDYGNEVVIPDPMVDRKNMAKVAYDEKGKIFVVAAGDSTRNLAYLNNKPLLMPQTIEAYDVLTLGNTELMFVPLCGEHFVWGE